MARWSSRDELPDSAKLELDLPNANERSNWNFQLLPFHRDATSLGWLRWVQHTSKVHHPRPVPQAV